MKQIKIYESQYNSLRDKALKRVESNVDKPNNSELNFLGLTTYLSQDNLDSSLVDKIIAIHNCQRKIEHIKNKEVYFMPLQVDAINYLFGNNRAMLLAPTSFGKTLIVKEYIYKKHPDSVVYIVPTNALSYELETSFKENPSFDGYDLFNKCTKNRQIDSTKKSFFIGTQEKYMEIKESLGPIDLLIIDEAYKLEDPVSQQRSYILSKSFLDSIKGNTNQIILLCPTAEVFGFEEYGFVNPFITTFNAVSKSFSRFTDSDSLYSKMNIVDRDSKTILYCDTPKNISDVYDKIDSIANDLNQSKFLKEIENDYHNEWSVAKYLKKGILVHHGQMPKYIQNKMIGLFNKKPDAYLLIGTNSISEGINTPTKNIFIDPNVKVNNKLMLIKNTIGRAGRLGEMPVGYIYSIEDIESLYKENPLIKLSIQDQNNLDIIEDSSNDNKILIVADEFGVDTDFIKQLIKEQQLSLERVRKILKCLQTDFNFKDFGNIITIASKCFKIDGNVIDNYIYIKGIFYNYYYVNRTKKMSLKTYRDRVDYFKYIYLSKGKEAPSDSEIIDGYMRFMYSTLDYKILPIALIAKKVKDNFPNWNFGKHVYESTNDFLRHYYSVIYNEPEFDSLDDNIKVVISSLREYGVNLNDAFINHGLFKEIEVRLSYRYSMYDIVRIMKQIASEDENNYKAVCKYLLEKYIE